MYICIVNQSDKNMETKLSIIIQSHLSDAALEASFDPDRAEMRINYVKFLIHTYPDTRVSIDAEKVFNDWYNPRYRD